jgi:hypothetical protein
MPSNRTLSKLFTSEDPDVQKATETLKAALKAVEVLQAIEEAIDRKLTSGEAKAIATIITPLVTGSWRRKDAS